jgi:hypothetical protein
MADFGKHTPGPWVWEHRGDEDRWVLIGPDDYFVCGDAAVAKARGE